MEGNISEIQSGLDKGSAKIEDLLKKDEQMKDSNKSDSENERSSPNQESQNSFVNREQLIKEVTELNGLI